MGLSGKSRRASSAPTLVLPTLLRRFADFFGDILLSFLITCLGQPFSIAPILMPTAPLLLLTAPLFLPTAPLLLPTALLLLPTAPLLLPTAPVFLPTAAISQ